MIALSAGVREQRAYRCRTLLEQKRRREEALQHSASFVQLRFYCRTRSSISVNVFLRIDPTAW
jgi:hypothetical protein